MKSYEFIKYRKAIIDDEIEIRLNPNTKETLVRNLQISLPGGAWISLSDFLHQNNWDKTIVGDSSKISAEEEYGVFRHVKGSDWQAMKKLFNQDANYKTDLDLRSNKDIVTFKIFLKNLILMQSA